MACFLDQNGNGEIWLILGSFMLYSRQNISSKVPLHWSDLGCAI